MRYFLSCAVFCMAVGNAAIAEVGWEGGITAVYQDTDDNQVNVEFTASADLFITLPQKKGEWLIYIEASTAPDANGISAIYPTANADAGSVLNRDGDGGLQVSEFNYTFDLRNDKTLMVGLIDPSAWLDRSRIANDENLHFLNGRFVNNPTIEFPDYTVGGVMRWPGTASRPEWSLVVASSAGIADLPDRSYQDLLGLTDGERGGFFGAGAGWIQERRFLRVGAWIRTDDHAVAGNQNDPDINYGVYGVYGWQSAADALSIRVGLANEEVSIATQFAAIAYERKMRFGLFGIGVAKTVVSDNIRQGLLDDVFDAEVFWRISIPGHEGHITPSIQYVENPGFDASGVTAGSSAIVAGLRFRWTF